MITTTPEINKVQHIIDSFNYKKNFTLDEHLRLNQAIQARDTLLTRLAESQRVDRKALIRARLGIK